MSVSVAAAALMLVGKLYAAHLTGSAAILSDALESVVHVVATAVAAFGIWWIAQPADEDHPYGHGKFAYFSAGIEGTLMAVAAVLIMVASVRSLVQGVEVQELGLGLAITGGLAAVNLGLGMYLIRVGKRYRSLILIANGQDVLTDFWTSLGVVVGVLMAWLTGLRWLDPVVALAVGLHIVWTAFQLLRTSFEGLMDHAPVAETEALDACLAQAVTEELIVGYHQVRHRRMGHEVLIECHLLFPDEITLQAAHTTSGQIERRIGALFPEEDVTVTTHPEPATHDDKHPESHAQWSL